jgi:hypothetical protein
MELYLEADTNGFIKNTLRSEEPSTILINTLLACRRGNNTT